ncbi:hypothetical protein PQX77_018603 [Marasmius sp. AFHP31]|nr:hypothetical protein PQX77_018603 [Marasmius sp. AFHP31]
MPSSAHDVSRFQPVIHSVLTSRMMLHLKRDAIVNNSTQRTQHGPSNMHSTRLRFAPRQPGQPSTESDDSLFDDSLPSIDHARSWFGEALRPAEPEPDQEQELTEGGIAHEH